MFTKRPFLRGVLFGLMLEMFVISMISIFILWCTGVRIVGVLIYGAFGSFVVMVGIMATGPSKEIPFEEE